MPSEPNVIPSRRLARWALLAVVVAVGVALYFRYGTRLPSFGAAPVAGADSAR